jgi:hypothetical protein
MHYEVYKMHCKAENITMSNWAIPWQMWKEMERKKTRAGIVMQGKLDGKFEPLSAPKTFTREGMLKAVAKHVVCDDQVGNLQRKWRERADWVAGIGGRRESIIQELLGCHETQ